MHYSKPYSLSQLQNTDIKHQLRVLSWCWHTQLRAFSLVKINNRKVNSDPLFCSRYWNETQS